MSAPAAKGRSEPVRTKQRTASSASAAFKAAINSPISRLLSAFSASGRFSRIRVTPSSVSTIRVSKLIEASSQHLDRGGKVFLGVAQGVEERVERFGLSAHGGGRARAGSRFL